MVAYKLFLDDFRSPLHCLQYRVKYMPVDRHIYFDEWVIVRSYEEFVDEIEKRYKKGEFPWLVSFDHDLADEHYGADVNSNFNEKTGYDCAKWLFNFCISHDEEIPKHFVHSMNSVGAERIHQTLEDFYRYREIMNRTRDAETISYSENENEDESISD